MIGRKRHRSSARLAQVIAGGFGPVFALPLLLDPYRWARAFGWKQEPETDARPDREGGRGVTASA